MKCATRTSCGTSVFGCRFRAEVGYHLKSEKCHKRQSINLFRAIRQRWRNKARLAVAPSEYGSKPQGVAGNAALPPYFEGSL
jgi:hypothetical protein